MRVTGLVMAGGKGSRMKMKEEKPLLTIDGRPMIEHIVNALKKAEKINEIIVTVSSHTPNTAKKAKDFPVKVLETPGKGYISDLRYTVKKLHLGTALTISADLPLVTNEVIDKVIDHYKRCTQPALTVMIPLETRMRLGLKVDYVFEKGGKRLIPTGINVIDGKKIDDPVFEEETLILDLERIAVNVNTLQDLKTAQHLSKTLQGKSRSADW